MCFPSRALVLCAQEAARSDSLCPRLVVELRTESTGAHSWITKHNKCAEKQLVLSFGQLLLHFPVCRTHSRSELLYTLVALYCAGDRSYQQA